MIIDVSQVNKPENWDDDLNAFGGSAYLSEKLLSALGNSKLKPLFLKFYFNEKVIGMLSGIEFCVGKKGEKQLFFYSGIAIPEDDLEMLKACKDALAYFAKKNGYTRMTFRSYDDTSYQYVKANKYYKSREREECVIDLSKDKSELENGFTKNVRRQVRKAKSAGVSFKNGNSPELLSRLLELMNNTYEKRIRKGYGSYTIFVLPFVNRNVMLRLLKANAATIYYAEYEGEIVSMQFTLKAAFRAYGMFMGTNNKGYELAAPSVLFYDIAFDLMSKGFCSYNLGGVTVGSKHDGVRRFKLTMGAQLFGSCEEKTYFLSPGLKKYNVLLRLKLWIDRLRIPHRIKRHIIQILNVLLGGRDSNRIFESNHLTQ